MKAGGRHITVILIVALIVIPRLCPAQLKDSSFRLPTGQNACYYDSLGVFYSTQADNKKAILFFKKSIALKKKEHNVLGLAYTYEKLSYSLQQLQKYRQAITYQMQATELKSEVLDSYYRRVKQLIPKANDSLNLTRLYYRYALFLSKKGKKRQGIDYYVQALKLAQGLHYDKAISTIANDLAGEYWDLGEKGLSNIRYREALAAAVRINDSNRMAAIYLNIGDNLREQGELEESMKQMLQALKIKEAIKDSTRLSFYYIKVAKIAKDARNRKKWKYYIWKAYEVKDLDHCASPMGKAIIYENLGAIAQEKGDYRQALQYYDTMLLISRSNSYVNGVKIALSNKSDLYRQMGRPEKALQFLQEADKYHTENPFYQISSRNTKAELYLETGDYIKAYHLLKKNIESPVLSNYADKKLQTLKLYYKVNTELANYKEAFQWNDSLRKFEDRLHDKDILAKIAELETKYQTEKNKHTINMLLAKNQIYDQQIRSAVLLIIILIVAIAFGIFMARMNKLKAEFRENQLRQQLLRSQMNPHFIFNALSTIQQMIQNHKTKEASFYLSRFASIARLVLEYSREESIPLDKEVEILRSYIELEKLRYGNSFEYEIQLPDDMEIEFIRIPPMAIQPFVENAIKHGLREIEKDGMLRLSFEDLGDVLKLVVEDNGRGIHYAQHQARKQHKSMAMKIFEERRRLLQKRYRKKLYIRFIDLSSEGETGTRVIIHLPIL